MTDDKQAPDAAAALAAAACAAELGAEIAARHPLNGRDIMAALPVAFLAGAKWQREQAALDIVNVEAVPQERLWVREHDGDGAQCWHHYGDGRDAPADCGKKPISGTPFVHLWEPDWPDAVICGTCAGAVRQGGVPSKSMKRRLAALQERRDLDSGET